MLKTAIFGGTFNPPHNGHIAMLKGIANLPQIEKILVMPAKAPPHKSGQIASAEHRVNMCQMAFSGVNKAQLCLLELEMQGKSYTVNTLEELIAKGAKNLVLVIGADSLITFNKWYRYEDILKLAELYVYPRVGENEAELLNSKKQLEALGASITLLKITPPDVSSTEVRQYAIKGKHLGELLPNSVAEYIREQGLYNGTDF